MAQHAVKITEQVLTFDAILSGVLGAGDAQKAKQWLDGGAQIEAPDPTQDWVYKDAQPQGFDTRIFRSAARGGGYESDSELEPSRSPTPVAARPPRPPSGKRPASRVSGAKGVAKPAAAPAAKLKRKATPPPLENLYARSAFVSHDEWGKGRGRAKKRSDSPQIQNGQLPVISRAQVEEAAALEELPKGWVEYNIVTGPAKKGGGVQKEEETSSYVSPEGVCCSSWEIAQGIEVARRHPGPTVAKLVAWVRAAASCSKPLLNQQVVGGVARQLVGLQRIRIVRNPQEKKCSEQRKRQNKRPVQRPPGAPAPPEKKQKLWDNQRNESKSATPERVSVRQRQMEETKGKTEEEKRESSVKLKLNGEKGSPPDSSKKKGAPKGKPGTVGRPRKTPPTL